MRREHNTQFLVWLCKVSLLAGLMMGLHSLGIAMIKTPWGASITLDCAIVLIALLSIDLRGGIVLSIVFGILSCIKGLNSPDPLIAAPLLSYSPIFIIILAILPRVCIPLVTYTLKKVISNKIENQNVANAILGALGSLTNTVLYLGTAFLLHIVINNNAPALLTAIGLTGVINGLCEAAFSAIIIPPVAGALKKLR